MPVIFLPDDGNDNEDCESAGDSKMSSFGFMSFAMAVVNAVINNANNVNNNNNNNNNNDNNNNNNIGNINVANSNNDVNNMNMVTAGRRRMLMKNTENQLLGNISSNVKDLTFGNNNKSSLAGNLTTLEEDNPIKTISIGYIDTNNHSLNHDNLETSNMNRSPYNIHENNLVEKFHDGLIHLFDNTKLRLSKLIHQLHKRHQISTIDIDEIESTIDSVIKHIAKIKRFLITKLRQISIKIMSYLVF